MQVSSVPSAVRQRIEASSAGPSDGNHSENSSGYATGTNSWASTYDLSSVGLGPDKPPLAWSGVRHQVMEQEKGLEPGVNNKLATHCSQAVLLTCLHLSHQMALRDVGLYAWAIPIVKDPAGSMLRIMKQYSQHLRELSTTSSLNIRTAPDPSRASIQHRLQKARLAAGPNAYVAVLYCGHGIQEPPTEAGELWCYDRSFEECAQQGGSPSEYIPILLFDLLTWAGSATCYIWDCQHAGRFIRAALTEADEIDKQLRTAAQDNPSVATLHPAVYARRQIHFAACGSQQIIPRIPGLPDDLFTACLTTPLRIALLQHNLQTFPLTSNDTSKYVQKSHGYMASLLHRMSDRLKARLWSELQAICNTIAWQALSGSDYQMLFGQSGDVVSSLAAGFLLSQRVMGAYRANPESIPSIPSSTSHSMWTHWDLILDNLFEQLPPYFDEDGDRSWEANLKLVSFMDDQLASILESDQSLFAADVVRPGSTAGLSRLPIICKAALTPEFRLRACTALDASLRDLDIRGLAHAVQGGALDVAAQLLALEDESIAPQMISIWSSLVRHETCVSLLASSGRTADSLTSVPSVKFFLEHLARNLNDVDCGSKAGIVRTAAVLSTIASHVSGREAPRFTAKTLTSASSMLGKEDGLVQQWGALLVAQVIGSIMKAKEQNQESSSCIKAQLLEMTRSSRVENRATAVYALSRWIDARSRKDILEINDELDLTIKIGPACRTDASALVRKEIVRLLQKVMIAGGRWTKLALWINLLGRAGKGLPALEKTCVQFVGTIGEKTGMGEQRKILLKRLNAIIRAYDVLRFDPKESVGKVVHGYLTVLLDGLRGYFPPRELDEIIKVAFPPAGEDGEWEEKMLKALLRAGSKLLDDWDGMKGFEEIKDLNNSDLFEESKLSLQDYLAKETNCESGLKQSSGKTGGAEDRGYALRYRLLEDSLVIAEQQVDLPWGWNMKEFRTTDSWSTITFHSFMHTAMSCNNSQNLLMWNWSSDRQAETVPLNIPQNAVVESARFVNELFERIFVLAEINNGDIHVLSSAPDEPIKMKTVSSFLALDIDRTMVKAYPDEKRMVNSWWRQSGKLAVGGMSGVLKVWDCPAERRDRSLNTNSGTPLTTLITEPVSGNLLLGGFADGKVKLWDLRSARATPVLQWTGDDMSEQCRKVSKGSHQVEGGRSISKLGVVLGESRYITEACSNGLMNIHDLRNLSVPTTSVLAHPRGISSASFQAHSGLMSTVSNLSSPSVPASADWTLYRFTAESINVVSSDTIALDQSGAQNSRPYTVVHNLRPFLGIGYGNKCYLKGSGVGKGDDTDSGSYSFLRAQMMFPER